MAIPEIVQGITIGELKGDTRSLDNGSYCLPCFNLGGNLLEVPEQQPSIF